MNRRQILFLKELLDKDDYAPLSEYSAKLKVSEKTLRRDIDEINAYLSSTGKSVKKKSGVGVRLKVDREEREKLINNLSLMNFLERN